MKALLKKRGMSIPVNFSFSYMTYKTMGYSGILFLRDVMKIEEAVALDVQREWIQHIEDDEWLKYDTLYEDALLTLNKIPDEKMFLTLRNNRQGLQKELRRFCLDKIDIIVLNHNEKKADAIKNINNDCMIIGDSEVDWEAANEIGCEFYMVNRGFRNKAYWDAKGVKSYDDLSSLI